MVLNALEARAHRCYSEQQQEPREAVTLADCGRLHPWRVRGRGLATEASGAAGYSLSLPHLHTAGSNISFAQTVSCFLLSQQRAIARVTVQQHHAHPRARLVFVSTRSECLSAQRIIYLGGAPGGLRHRSPQRTPVLACWPGSFRDSSPNDAPRPAVPHPAQTQGIPSQSDVFLVCVLARPLVTCGVDMTRRTVSAAPIPSVTAMVPMRMEAIAASPRPRSSPYTRGHRPLARPNRPGRLAFLSLLVINIIPAHKHVPTNPETHRFSIKPTILSFSIIILPQTSSFE